MQMKGAFKALDAPTSFQPTAISKPDCLTLFGQFCYKSGFVSPRRPTEAVYHLSK